MVKIGVCDVNEDETRRTVYLLESQMKNAVIDKDNVTIASHSLESIMLDLDDQRFDYDIFITELSFYNGRNGVELAKRINKAAPSCNIIFYTNKIPNELDIYESRHVNCMLKGRHDGRLVMTTGRLIEALMSEKSKAFIKIRFDRNIIILDCQEIMYIKIENRVTKFYTARTEENENRVFCEYRPLSEIIKELPDNFVRCSASAVVNKNHIKQYNHQTVTMMDGAVIKIRRRYGDVVGG